MGSIVTQPDVLQASHYTDASTTAMSFAEVKRRLEQDMAALSSVFHVVTGGGAASDDENDSTEPGPSTSSASSAGADGAPITPNELVATLLASIPSLQKRLDSLLRDLFITNLFRTCCCWLAENMALVSAAVESEEQQEEFQDSSAVSSSGASISTTLSAVASTDPTATDDEQQDVTIQRAVRRRRTSLTNTRRVLETFQRDGTSMDMLDRDIDRMKDTYADSASLLFKAERAAIVEAAVEQRRVQERVEATQIITNPITGQPEEAPIHTVDPMVPIEPSAAQKVKETARMRCNRKKEELRHAMMLRQLDRMAVKVRRRSSVAAAYSGEGNDDETDDNVDEAGALVLPAVHGDALPLGNFILRSLNDDASITDSIDLSSWTSDGESAPSSARHVTEPSMIEAMWKRGARGASKSSKTVGENGDPGSLALNKDLPSTNVATAQSPTPDPAKRVQSASRRTAESDPMTRRIRNRRSSVHGAGAFSTAGKLDSTSPVQPMVGAITRGQSECDVAHAKRVLDGGSDAHSEGIGITQAYVGDCAREAEAVGNAPTDESKACGDASTASLSTIEVLHLESADSDGCSNSTMIPEEHTYDREDDTQHERQDINPSVLIAAVVVVGGATDHDNVPANTGDSSTLVGPDLHDDGASLNLVNGLPVEAVDASAEELDAFLASMRSRPLSADLVDSSTPSTPPDRAGSLPTAKADYTGASNDSRLNQGDDKPLIFWEMQPGAPEIRRGHSMVVQRLPLSGSTSTRHVIEYRHASATAESSSSQLTIGRVAQRTQGSSVLEVANAVEWEEVEDNLGSPLSLHGKSLRMEGRRGRAELSRRSQQTVSGVGMDSTLLNAHAVRKSHGTTDATDDRDSSERGVAVPAITINVVAKTVASAADVEDTSAGVGVLSSTGEALTPPPQASVAKRGPFFVLDTEGSTSTVDQLPTLEIAGVNTRVADLGSSLSEGTLTAGARRTSATKSTTTTKTAAESTSKTKGAASKKEELN